MTTGFGTPGSDVVYISGTNFGPANGVAPIVVTYTSVTGGGRRVGGGGGVNGTSGNGTSGSGTTATVPPTPLTFTALNCAVTQANVQITCLTAPGAGANLQVRGGNR